MTGASDEELEKEEEDFLDLFLPKVVPPPEPPMEEPVVIDQWPATTPAPMPTAMKDMFLPVKFFLILSQIYVLIWKLDLNYDMKYK